MSFSTKPAYIYNGVGFPDGQSDHPIMEWLRDYQAGFDNGQLPVMLANNTPWHTADYVHKRGSIVLVGEAGRTKLAEDYSAMSGHLHQPSQFIIYETDDGKGYKVLFKAEAFVNFKGGLPGCEVGKEVSADGRKWDVKLNMAGETILAKDPAGHKGYKLKSTEIQADELPLVVRLVQKGSTTWEQVTTAVTA